MPSLPFRLRVTAALVLATAVAASAGPAAKPAEREWLVLAYVSAVNERGLDGSAKELLNHLERHGSTGAVTLLAKYALLEKGAAGEPVFPREAPTVLVTADGGDPALTSPRIDVSPSVDMASGSSLTLFCRKAMRQYPAKRTMLLFFGAGDGLAGLGRDDLSRKSFGVADFARALGRIVKEAGRPFDLLALDADGMQSLEAAWEWRDLARVIVGHAERAPRVGLLWDLALGDLLANPGWDAREFARSIVYYADAPSTSALDTANLEPFAKLLDRFVAATLADPAALRSARAARGEALAYRMRNAKDLGDFVMRTCERLPPASPAYLAGRDLLRCLDRDLAFARHAALEDPDTGRMIESPDYKRQRGLAVHLPDAAYDPAVCEGLAFAARSTWRELVFALLEPPRE